MADDQIKSNIPYVLAATKGALHERILGIQMELGRHLRHVKFTKDSGWISNESLMSVSLETALLRALSKGDYRNALLIKKQWQDATVEENMHKEENGAVMSTEKDENGELQSVEVEYDSKVTVQCADLMRYKFEEFEARLRACRLQMIADEIDSNMESPRSVAMQKYKQEAMVNDRRVVDFTFASYELKKVSNGVAADVNLAIDLQKSVLGLKNSFAFNYQMVQEGYIDMNEKYMIFTDPELNEGFGASPMFQANPRLQPPEEAKKGQ